MDNLDPVIALIDMDCFYVQVELRRQPEFRGKPAGVTQYLTRYKGGGLIAVNYEAKAAGVKRGFRADEAKEKAADMKIFSVPELNGKADLTRYRDAGSEVLAVINRNFSVVERASVDEAFVDLSTEVRALLPKYVSGELKLSSEELGATCTVGRESVETWIDNILIKTNLSVSAESERANLNNLALAVGAKLIHKLRMDIFETTEFHCSAGISYSKTLAKLACGINKPQKQTVLSAEHVVELFEKTEIQDIRFLGGKLGDQIVNNLGIKYMAELCRTPKSVLLRFFEPSTASWLQSLGMGRDNEPVQQRNLPKSIGCSKNFLGRAALWKREDIRHWMGQFSHELSQRLEKDQSDNDRTATLLTAHVTIMDKQERRSLSRCCPLSSYTAEHLAQDGYVTADKLLTSLGFQDGKYSYPVVSLGMVASKMKDGKDTSANRIENYFQASASREASPTKLRLKNGREPHEPQDENYDLDKIINTDEETVRDRVHALEDIPELIEETDKLQSKIDDQKDTSGSIHDQGDEELEDVLEELQAGTSRPHDGEELDALIVEDGQEDGRFKAFNCEECGKYIWCPLSQQEHDDYHLALRLSQQIDSSGPRKKLKLEDVPVKRKPKKASSSILTIDQYFRKNNSTT